MNSFKQYLSACIGVAVLIGMLGLLVPHASYGAAKDVNVINTPNVNVVNQPTVTVDDATPINVNVQGGAIAANVTVDNVGTNPVPVLDVDSPARQRFAETVSFTIVANAGSGGSTLTVPANKILVIEHVSLTSTATFQVAADGVVTIAVTTFTNGTGHRHISVVADKYSGFGSQTKFSLSQPFRIYADPESTVTLILNRNFFGPMSAVQGADITISGHLVDP